MHHVNDKTTKLGWGDCVVGVLQTLERIEGEIETDNFLQFLMLATLQLCFNRTM